MISNKELKKYYLICYDVKETKQRTKLMKWLENFGVRVQKSVFEAYLQDDERERMIEGAKNYIEDYDSLRVYKLTKNAYKEKVVFGLSIDYKPYEDIVL